MVNFDNIRDKIRLQMPDAEVHITDLTGTGDHLEAQVTSAAFEGKSRVEQHRMVYAALEEELKGEIHALALKTGTPTH